MYLEGYYTKELSKKERESTGIKTLVCLVELFSIFDCPNQCLVNIDIILFVDTWEDVRVMHS